MKRNNKIILIDTDIDNLSDHALALWVRLCRHALIKACSGDPDYNLLTTTTISNSEEDLQELANLEYLIFSSVVNDKDVPEYHIELLKYDDNHPTYEDVQKHRKLRNSQNRRYRNKSKK